jgi:uncharacterized protein (TIGR03437 family)
VSKLVSLGAVAVAVLVTASAAFAVAKPSITKFAPTTVKPGASFTITGKDLMGATKVEVNGMKATFKVVSSTKITAKVPAKAKSGKVTVVTKGGTAVSSAMLKV